MIKGMSHISGILVLSYRLKCFALQRTGYISATKGPTEMGFGSKCYIFNGQLTYIGKSKWNIANMRLIPLHLVTFISPNPTDCNF